EGEAPAAHAEAWRPAQHLETRLLDAVDVLGADDATRLHARFELHRLAVGVGGVLEKPDALPVDGVPDPGTLHAAENASLCEILRPAAVHRDPSRPSRHGRGSGSPRPPPRGGRRRSAASGYRSEEHTSELQSR